MVLSQVSKWSVMVVAITACCFVLTANLEGQLIRSYSEDFNDDLGNTFTRDSLTDTAPGGMRVDQAAGQQKFSQSPGTGGCCGADSTAPWGTPSRTAVFGDGALQLGSYPGGARKATVMANHGVFSTGTYSWDLEWENYYTVGGGVIVDERPASGFTSGGEKRLETVLLSNHLSGDTNVPSRGVKIKVGQGASWAVEVDTLEGPGVTNRQFSYHPDYPGSDVRPWTGGVSNDVDKNRVSITADISSSGLLDLWWDSARGGKIQLIDDLDVSAGLADNGGIGRTSGYWNITSQDSGTALWDSFSYNIPEPSSLILVCLGGLGLLIRRKR